MKRLPERLFAILKDNGFTPFQIRVYRTVSAIPWGQTRSYKWVAERLGRPGASRAEGQALKKNPLFFIIPITSVISHYIYIVISITDIISLWLKGKIIRRVTTISFSR